MSWNDPPTTLTSFGPLSSDVTEGTSLFSRLWKRTKNGSRSASREGSTERTPNKSVTMVTEKNREAIAPLKVLDISAAVDSGPGSEVKSESRGSRSGSRDETGKTSVADDQRTSTNTTRTLTGVLNRLSSIVQTGTPQTYKDSDFKQYWMPDESCKECYDCGDKFTTFRRRHHCRICGQIFCSKCCNQELQGRIIGYKGGIRVCTYCGKVAMSALQNEPSGNISVDKEDLQLSMEGEPGVYSLWGSKKMTSQDLSRLGSGVTPTTPSIDVLIPFDLSQNTTDTDMYTGLGRKFLEDSVQLREIWRQILDPSKGVEMQSHRIRLKTYYKCIVGNKLVDWLLTNDKAAQRMQAVVIGQALLDAGYLEIIGGQQNIFQDNFTLYKPSETTPIDPPDNNMTGTDKQLLANTDPQWLQEIDVKPDQLDNLSVSEDHAIEDVNKKENGSVFYIPLPLQVTEEKDFEPLPRQDSHAAGYTEDIISTSMFGGSSQSIPASKLIKSVCWRNSDTLKEDNGERKAYSLLKKSHQDHLNGLVQQMLFEEGLSKSWIDIVLGTAQRVSNYVRPDVREEGDDMNILKYVKFKKIPGDSKEQTWLVHGVVFTRNIAHKKMSQKLVNPYILLLKGSIEYQRVEHKFSSLEPQILQEEEFLKKNVKKISSLNPKPNIVIVEKSVSRLAQNYLLEKGITLVYNVKLSVMERIERLTQGCIVPSIDGILSGPITLGFCHNFKVCHFTLPSGEAKTLLCFDGCAQHLGCTIVLRGGSRGELAKIKKVMRQMITACYNSQLEISYSMDEFAMPESRADDTIRETDSVMNFIDMEKTSVKVSDYLQDNKSGVSVLNNEPLEHQNSKSEVTVLDTNCKEHHKNDKNETHKNETEKGDTEKGQGTETNTAKLGENENKPKFKLGENENKPKFKLGENENKPKFKLGESDIDFNDKNSVTNTGNEITDSSKNIGENKVSSSDLKGDKSSLNENSDGKKMLEMNKKPSHTESVGSFIAISVDGVTNDNCDSTEETDIPKVIVKVEDQQPKLKRQLSGLIPLDDQSDPLHIYQKNHDDAIFFSSVTLQEKTQKRFAKFRKILSEVYLSMSPYIKFEVPYLDTEGGSGSIVRKFFPEDLYWSKYFEPVSSREKKKHTDTEPDPPCKPASPWSDIEITEPHPLILTQITGSLTDKKLQHLLADFRARGGRIKLKPRVTSAENEKQEFQLRKLENQKVNQNIDCLDYSNHQKFTVLLSSHSEKSTNYPNPCVPPQIVSMPFYNGQDMTLGGFLEKFCFRDSYCCQPYMCPSENCEVPLLDHVRRIVHDHGSIFISLRKLANCVPGGDKDIMMWNWCRKCRQATPLAAMSNDTWSFSFAKFLELRFHVNTFTRRVAPEPCSHSLHHSFSQYFGRRNIVATFKYMPVIKKEIALPPNVISLQTGIQSYQWEILRESMRSVEKRGLEMYSSIHEQLVSVNSSNDELTKMVGDLTNILESEKHRLKDLIYQGRLKVFDKLTEKSDNISEFFMLYDESLKMMRFLADADINWRSKMQELYSQHKKTKQSNQTKKDKDISISVPSTGEPAVQSKKEKDSIPNKEPVAQTKTDKDNTASAPSNGEPVLLIDKGKDRTGSLPSNWSLDNDLTISVSSLNSARDDLEKTRSWSGVMVNKSELPSSEPVPVDQSYFLAESGIYSVTPGLAAGIHPYNDKFTIPTDSPYVLLQIQEDQEILNAKPSNNARFTPPGTKPDPSMSASNFTVVPRQIDCNDRSRQTTDSTMSESKTLDIQVEKVDTEKKTKSKKEGGKKLDDYTDSQQMEKISGIMKKTITNLLSGSGLPPLPFPFDCREHHLLPTCYKVPVVVYDQEPSSIIAYALSSYDYHYKLQEIQSAFSTSQKFSSTKDFDETGNKETPPSGGESSKKNTGSMLSFVRNKDSSPKLVKVESVHYNPKLDTGSGENDEDSGFSILSSSLAESDKFKSGKPTQGPHIELQYADHMAKFYCKIYFAEQFRKLRKLIFPAGEEMFIRSLSRCKMWEAKGGKSGSKFCKTDDQRFILKQMSSPEIDVFEKFGPEYFNYISKSYLEQKPTALGKIVGAYRIGFRNTHTNAGIRQDLLVMENLLYDRKISQTFDLKGSERNRLASTSGKREEEQVLLDTNLLNLSIESPLYIYPHSKTLLMSVINRDSQFLSANLVMDYSLLVGLDENKNELVLGIIDYIRTFTWDKKLETIIKSAGGKLPTVVSPDMYRSRFLSAMTRYFLPVPDQWTGKDFDPSLS